MLDMTPMSPSGPHPLPHIIQGGMGVGVSSWELAGTVTAAGQLGVVSGTALEVVYARRLQLGDPGGHVRRAFEAFPIPSVAERVRQRYFVDGGIPSGQRFKSVPTYTLTPPVALLELSVLTNFSEVWLAKERGGGGPVGINYLYKIQMPLLASLYGALLAGVDCVIIGAGNPREVPAAMTRLARGDEASLTAKVFYADAGDDHRVRFDPRSVMGDSPPTLPRPRFLAIVSSAEQAAAMCDPTSDAEVPDGFVVESHPAGGHNAPPRGPMRLSSTGEPVYGPRDAVDFEALTRLGRPFWLAGGFGTPEGLREAERQGASGVQVGTAFALCRESGLAEELKAAILDRVVAGRACVFTDSKASPTGFPFKVVALDGTLSDDAVYAARERVCDLGFLRAPFKSGDDHLGYRCPAEPERLYQSKRGRPDQSAGRKCLCNGLLANIGLAQIRKDDRVELPLVTAGDDLVEVGRFLKAGARSFGARDVLDALQAV